MVEPNPRYKGKRRSFEPPNEQSPNEQPPKEQPPKEQRRRERPSEEDTTDEEINQRRSHRPELSVARRRYINTTEDDRNTGFEKCATIFSIVFVVLLFPVAIFFCLSVLKEFQRGVVLRLGRLRKGTRGPGIVFILPCIDSMAVIDLRTEVEEVPPQDVITSDSVTIRVDAVLFYSIYNPMDALLQVDDVEEATIFLAQTTLRNAVGSKPLMELLTSREKLSKEITEAVDEATERWGVRVERVELKDISLPEAMQRALASEAEALREARAKIISAQGELNASKALKEASDVMATNKITLQLRHLQILTSIATERNCRIIFPFPMDMMTPFEEKPGTSVNKRGGGGNDGDDNKKPIKQRQDEHPSFSFGLPFFAKRDDPDLPHGLRTGTASRETREMPPDVAQAEPEVAPQPETAPEPAPAPAPAPAPPPAPLPVPVPIPAIIPQPADNTMSSAGGPFLAFQIFQQHLLGKRY
ncbi:erythrocyte band 7 integral membrane protein-like [Scaptodrosophila lebanonensis]|uniref:Erythrocyte band 7 integral membrane protein-like n=1 Tax=Drosophila lebanonensis TaxID=7225 RepID=A0A6J2TGG3_DROLE|nr:erythrocyte band 7 integral membrane protein-like [Scaptodrosophila lebanonensis]